QFDTNDTGSIVLYGGGVLTALWLTTAVVGAIDSIPLFPKLLEVVGLAYTVWFTSRYLLFKQSRDELATKIEEVKEQIFGSEDN
ncbi:protein CURVATURE THYLAKOID 1D, chloroplastic, partial [Vigna umbellata]|uniref:protein CURVATURE THYLAKOID 1D, chloroplastic n=1 Tax=Vigna umbellata TaxID=87088 RepID=UPI001F5F9E72